MTFSDQLANIYRKVRQAALSGNRTETVKGLRLLSQMCESQFCLENNDPIVTKAQLKQWKNNFSNVALALEQNGFTENIKRFFGIKKDSVLIDIDGLTSEDGQGNDKDRKGNFVGGNSDKEKEPEYPDLPSDKQNITENENDSEEKDKGIIADGNNIPQNRNKSMEPASLDEFIGQQHIVKRIKKEIVVAKAKGLKYLNNILLFGNPGLGKTTLMKLIAKELGVRFELLDCAKFPNSHTAFKGLIQFLSNIARLNEPVFIGMDEIHCLGGDLQASLLSLLNDRIFISPPDSKTGQVVRIPIENFTFCGTTTDDDKVLPTIKDRCRNLTFQMVEYTREELRQIIINKLATKGLSATDDVLETCVNRCRSSIREVNAIVEGFDTYVRDDITGQIVTDIVDKEIAERYFSDRKIDGIGLTEQDVKILKVLMDAPSMTLSVETLASKVGMSVNKYSSEYEPYLSKIDFITIINRGRTLTEKGIKYLNEAYGYGLKGQIRQADKANDKEQKKNPQESLPPENSDDNGPATEQGNRTDAAPSESENEREDLPEEGEIVLTFNPYGKNFEGQSDKPLSESEKIEIKDADTET